MNKKQIERLGQLFQHSKARARSRIFLYLLCIGYGLDELASMRVGDLRALEDVPEILSSELELVFNTAQDADYLFTFPSGRRYSVRNLLDVVQSATVRALGEEMSVDRLRQFVDKGRL